MSEPALETVCDSDSFSRGAAFPSLTANPSCLSGLSWSEAVQVGSGFGQNLISQTDPTGNSSFLFGPGIDEPLAMSKNGAISYFDVDGLGSVVATNDPSGTVTHSVVFDAWGNTRAETGTRTHPFTYTGREVGEAGLLYYRARYYDPSIGRFIQEDPLGQLSGDLNMYRYVINRPIMAKDPSGKKFTIDPSCNCLRQEPEWPFLNLHTRLDSETEQACSRLDIITDPKLRSCVEKRCDSGRIKCGSCKAGWGAFFQPPAIGSSSTINLCSEIPWFGSAPGELGRRMVHEWAHSCGWPDGGGLGVPDPWVE